MVEEGMLHLHWERGGGEEEMDNQTLVHMNHGNGERSYAQNSNNQMKVIMKELSIVKDILKDMFFNSLSSPEMLKDFKIADLGCGSGSTALLFASEIIDILYNICKQTNKRTLEILVVLNDVHKNDFNNLFDRLPLFYDRLKKKYGHEFGKNCFLFGLPASFYGRLFPSKSLHFVHSSYSLHWLSQVPQNLDNKGHIYITKQSPPNVIEAHKNQFSKDFSCFLTQRSHEIMPMGRMALTLLGRSDIDHSSTDCVYLLELLAQSLLDMTSEGFIKQEDVDSFNIPVYMPYKDEVEAIIIKEKSFDLEKIEIFKCNWNSEIDDEKTTNGESVAKSVRAVIEPLLVAHFGRMHLDKVFNKYAEHIDDYLKTKTIKVINLTVCLVKK